MKGLHLVSGEKGGVGKSLFAQILLEYCRKNQIKYQLFDADRTSPDVGEIYEPKIYKNGATGEYKADNSSSGNRIYFSEEAEDVFLADQLFTAACEQLVIVNLPAQVSVMVDTWLNQGGILDLAKQENVEIVFWFVTDGSPESITLLGESLSTYKNTVKTVLVVNEGLSKQAIENLKNSSIADRIKTQTIATIKMPLLFLSSQEKKLIKEKKIDLTEAANRNKKEGLTLIAKQRITQFIRQCHQQIDEINLFDVMAKPKEQKAS